MKHAEPGLTRAAVGALLVLAALGCQPARDRRAHLTVATSWNGTAAEALHRELIVITEKLGPVTIEVRSFGLPALADYLSRSQATGARQGLDLVVVPNDWLSQLAELEVIGELPTARIEMLKARIVPHALVAVTNRNRVLGYPISAELLALVYDPERLPSPPRTLDELAAAVAGTDTLPFALDLTQPSHLAPFVSSYQGSLLDADGNLVWTADSLLAVFRHLAPLWSRDNAWRAFSGQDLESLQLQLFAEGKLASFLARPSMLDALEECGRPFAVGPVPAFTDAPHPASALVGYQCVAVTRESNWADLALEVGARLLGSVANERLNRGTRQLSVLLDSFQSEKALASQGTVGFLRALELGQFLPAATHWSERLQSASDRLQRLARRNRPPTPDEMAAIISGGRGVKLRWQLVLSHVGTIVVTGLVIGAVNVFLLLRSSRTMELQSLGSALSSSTFLLAQRAAALQHARDEIAAFVAENGRLTTDIGTLGKLHDFLAVYGVARVEVFRGLRKEVEAYRWEGGVGPALATAWLPPKPQVAAQIVAGRPSMWVQRKPGERAALKLCATVPGSQDEERRWVVVTEPLDGVLLEKIIPSEFVGALRDDRTILAGWPETPRGSSRDLSALESYLARGPFSGLLPPVVDERPVLQLDDGTSLDLVLLSAPVRSGQNLVQGLRLWFLVTVSGALIALVIGSALASRILAPLNALLEGTAAMARGHLMVRLPTTRNDELGALTREFNRMADETRNTYMGVVSTLAELVEAKSHYTREHIERVERLSMATLDVLERRGWVRFSSHQRFLLAVSAILHDVGKIAIGNEILNKSGPLESHEREQILTHPEVGALIVERMGKLERAAEIIRCAHEHFDGSGYPRGLKGEEIPLEARIILVVDAFDAMTIDRPYSTGRPTDDAIAELRAFAGRQFDPVVVEAFIEVVTSEDKGRRIGSADSGLYRVLHADSDSERPRVTLPLPASPE